MVLIEAEGRLERFFCRNHISLAYLQLCFPQAAAAEVRLGQQCLFGFC